MTNMIIHNFFSKINLLKKKIFIILMASQIIKDFNTLLEALIQQVAPLTGNSYHLLYKNLIKINALMPIQTFAEYGTIWKQQIESRDESFFLDSNTMATAAIDSGNDNQVFLNNIFRLQGIWSSLDSVSKDNLWEMIYALYTLSEQYKQIKN